MYSLTSQEEPKKQEFNTANALSETSKPSFDLTPNLTDDDYDFYKARESAGQLQSDYLSWQSTTQEKKGKDGVNISSEYDTWEKDERSTLSKDMNENQLSYFNRFADEHDKLNRPWAKKHESEQRKTYGIDTQNSYITSNKAMLAANMHDENYVNSSLAQILSATTELSRLQGLGEQETTDLKLNNVNDAIKSAIQGKVDAEDWENAAALYRRNGHYLNEANRQEITGNITALHSKAQNRKKVDDVSAKLLQMDEDAAAIHLNDNNWLGSMNIPEELIPELKEVNAYQRQSALRKEKTTKNEKEFTWFDKVLTANVKDPMKALRLVQSREDIDPELRSSVVSAIQNGRIDTIDDPATMFALQDRIFGDNPDVESGEFAIEIGKGNLKINTFKELFEMQKNLNKGEKNLVRKALHILDASFEGDEDFTANPNRLAARNMYLKSLNKAIANNDTGTLVQLTNKEHVQSVGQSFSAGNVFSKPISNAQNNQQNGNFLQKMFNGLQSTFGSNSAVQASDVPVNTAESNISTTLIPTSMVTESNDVYVPSEAVTQRTIIERLKKDHTLSDDYPKYTDEAFGEVKNAKNDIHAAAKAYGIPAMSIAGAIVDEYSSQKAWNRGGGFFDWAQDLYVKDSNLDDVRKNHAKGAEGQGIWSDDSAKHDIGPGNFGVRTALELFEKNIIQDKNDNPIKSFLYKNNASLANATEQKKWEAYIKNMVLTTEGTAWLAAAEMQKGLTALDDKKAIDGLSDIEKAGVLMTWYKQGQSYLDRYNGRPTNEVRPIGIGEGRGLFHYYDKFEEILK